MLVAVGEGVCVWGGHVSLYRDVAAWYESRGNSAKRHSAVSQSNGALGWWRLSEPYFSEGKCLLLPHYVCPSGTNCACSHPYVSNVIMTSSFHGAFGSLSVPVCGLRVMGYEQILWPMNPFYFLLWSGKVVLICLSHYQVSFYYKYGYPPLS